MAGCFRLPAVRQFDFEEENVEFASRPLPPLRPALSRLVLLGAVVDVIVATLSTDASIGSGSVVRVLFDIRVRDPLACDVE